MPARARQHSSPPPADEEEAHQVLTRVQQTTLSRRKTIAVDVPFQSPQSSGQASKAAPRQSLPSHAVNDLLSTPRSSQSLAQIRNSSQDLTPKRAAFLGSTVEKRFEALGEYASSILNFYQDYANRLTLPGLHLADAMDQQLDRYWNMFHSSRKNQVFPSKSNEDDFLDPSVVLQANTIDPDSELAIEIIDKITTANRATFVHYVAQLPFRLPSSTLSPETQPWSVNKLVEYLSQGKHERWPMRNVDELLLARKEFFKKIVPRRRKVLVTLDDLHLFLDLCTQIAIYYMWKFSTTKSPTERQKKVDGQIRYLFSTSPLVDALDIASEDDAQDENGAFGALIEDTYEKMSIDRIRRFQELKHAPATVQKEFPFQVTAAAIINYANGLRAFHPIPLRELDDGLAIPRSTDHIFSPGLRASFAKSLQSSDRAREAMRGDAVDQDAEGNDEEVEQPSGSRLTGLRFNKDNRLERVDSAEVAPSIVNKRHNVEGIRDSEFDEGDSDVFLERQMRERAVRGKGKKRAAPARKGKAAAPKEPAREGDSDDELPDLASLMPELRPDHPSQSESRRRGVQAADGFEVTQEELQAVQQKSEARQKRKRAEREESEYLPPTASGGPSSFEDIAEGSSGPPTVKVKQERLNYRYATGGNQLGRVAWSEDETNCLLNDLVDLHPLYLEALGRNVRFAIWKEILKRHGQGGSLSTRLQNRNNVQLKDKARNEVERRKRAQQEVSNGEAGTTIYDCC